MNEPSTSSSASDGSDLDCIECGGYVDIQRAERICLGCQRRMKMEHEAYVAAGKELQTFRCAGCGAVEFYDPPEFYLLRYFQAAQAFDDKHQHCQPSTAAHAVEQGVVE